MVILKCDGCQTEIGLNGYEDLHAQLIAKGHLTLEVDGYGKQYQICENCVGRCLVFLGIYAS